MKQTHSIAAAALLLAGGIMLSRVLGYIREVLLTWKFGASGVTDAFYAAFQIPDLLNYFLAGGALSIAFIPLYNRILAREGEAAAKKLTDKVFGTLGLVAVIATALLFWKAEALTRFQFPMFDEETTRLTVKLTRIVLPAQIFFIAGGIAQAVLLAHHSFIAAALAPLIYNACILAGGMALYSLCGIEGFAYGTLAGSFAGPFLLPWLHLRRAKIVLFPRFAPWDKQFLIYLAAAAPLMLGQTLLTLDEWYGRWFGGLLEEGTVAHLTYARRLIQVPVAVIGQAVAAAALPMLSKLWAEGKTEELNGLMQRTLCVGLSLSVITTAGFCAMAGPLVGLVYQQGAFGAADAAKAAGLVAIFAFAVPGWILQQISVRAFYARGDTWRPMMLGTILSLAVIPLYMGLTRKGGAEGIALAGVFGMTANAIATIILARRMHGAPDFSPVLSAFARTTLICAPAAMAAVMSVKGGKILFKSEGLSVKLAALLDGALGGLAFCLVAVPGIMLFGDRELRDWSHLQLRKFNARFFIKSS